MKQLPVLALTAFQTEHNLTAEFQYHEIRGQRFIEHPHKHDFFVFLLIERGSGEHTIDFTKYEVGARQLHLLFPDQVHQWKFGKSTRAYQLMFSKSLYAAISTAIGFSFPLLQQYPVIPLTDSCFKLLLHEFRAIKEELNNRAVHWPLIQVRCHLIAQLAGREAEHTIRVFETFRAHPLLSGFHALVDAHYLQEKSVSFYAEKLAITPNYLTIICKRHLHMSAQQLIHNRLILEAKRLVLATDQSLKEIAYTLGFQDPAYFSNFFKLHTGKSPREFRQQL